MDEFPDPEDEFELLHAQEMEAMREMEEFDVEEASRQAALIPPSFKRSLNFTSPTPLSRTPTNSPSSRTTTSSEPSSTTTSSEPSNTTTSSEPSSTNTSSEPSNTTTSSEPSNTTTSSEPSNTTNGPPLSHTTTSQGTLLNDGGTSMSDNGVERQTQLGGTITGGRKRPPPEDDGFEEALDILDQDDFATHRKKRSRPLVPMLGLSTLLGGKKSQDEQNEEDMLLIQQITELRNSLSKTQQHNIHHQDLQGISTALVDRVAPVAPNIHRHIPSSGDFQAVTTDTGRRFYLGRLEEDEWDARVAAVGTRVGASTHLAVGSSYLQLKAQVEREQIRRDAQLAKRIRDEEDSGMESGVEEETEERESLWVEKFKPQHYLDLLSDESTNRLVLHWLKLWDKLVFGVDKKPKKQEKKKKDFQKDNKFNKFGKKFGPEVIEELDDHNRPVQKVLLLAGPPGLGKTTLAHVLGRHAGYHTLEINASNDRSPEAFRTALETAATMRSVLGLSPRPNCLVMDEIDGAPAPSINLLVNMLTGKDMGRATKKGSKKKEATVLHRPVICICNDLYTPALRPLRQIALVVQFPPTHTARLAQRLLEITRKRDLRADLSVLMALCDKTENDIRSCLSVLQFVRSSRREVRLEDVMGAAVGQKDHQRSLFNMWSDIFSIPRQKKIRRNPLQEPLADVSDGTLPPMPDLNGDLSKVGEDTALNYRVQRILSTTYHAPFDKLTQGWFHNYLNIKTASLDNISRGLDWASFTDIQLAEVGHSQSWSLMAYLPYACVSYHLLFASHQWYKIQFPTQMNEIKQKQTKMENLITAMVNDMSPKTRAHLNPPSPSRMTCDLLPFLLHIIQPNLRPVNTQLYSKQERADLNALIDTMLAYNLTYTQERDQNGQYSFTLDPNIEEVVQFPDMKSERQLSYPMRQLISREVELERVRRAEARFTIMENETSTTSKDKRNPPSSKPQNEVAATANNPKVPLPNHLHKLQAKPLSKPGNVQGAGKKVVDGEIVQAPRDFFGRVIENPVNHQAKSTNNEIVKSDIWFRFKEGYSNAVRRTIRMKDL
ncbi:hypothetical protein Pmani_013421 [Petrolisthes manimaculis]|uniref:AAA+ ATPase domain-containing protein n=1 Tax=Petrolisthes manimaculis TaxID=1843537 RepID=A0AAE1PW37_9EUCA|nr:hypothetical protein Pmani_013421 [Petrolisthes manimaculis]